jgi:hypothetical protein
MPAAVPVEVDPAEDLQEAVDLVEAVPVGIPAEDLPVAEGPV